MKRPSKLFGDDILQKKQHQEESNDQQNKEELEDKKVEEKNEKKESQDDVLTQKQEQENKKQNDQPQSGLLFGNLFNIQLPTNNNNQQGESKGLFANLFNNNNSSKEQGQLFGSLFNNSTGNNFFQSGNNGGLNFSQLFDNSNINKNQDKNNEDGDEDEDGNDEGAQEQSPEIDPTLSKGNYQYEDKFSKKVNVNILKCKVNEQDAFDGGKISIEQHNESKVYNLFYRTVLKRILYNAIIVPQLVFYKTIAQPSSNSIQVNVHIKNAVDQKLTKNQVKIKFNTKEELDLFTKVIDEIKNQEE